MRVIVYRPTTSSLCAYYYAVMSMLRISGWTRELVSGEWEEGCVVEDEARVRYVLPLFAS